MSPRQRLIVVRGIGDERQRLARLLATALDGPAVHVPGDDIGARWIVAGLPDPSQERASVYRLLRLIVISYLKEGFSVVVDAPFVELTDAGLELRTQEIRDLTRLAHSFRGIDTGVVTLESPFSEPRQLAEALKADTYDGEVRVVSDLMADDRRAAREIMLRLGM